MNRARALLERIRTEPRAQDWVIFAGFLIAGVREPFVLDISGSDRAVEAAAAVLIAAGLLWRRTRPAAAVVWFALIVLALAAFAPDAFSNATVPFIALFFYFYAVGAHAELRQVWPSCAFAAVIPLATVFLTESDDDIVGALIFPPIFMGVPLLVGHSLRSRRILAAELEEKTHRMEHDREEQARRAVEGERARIARELHDVVAHSISVMTVQAEAVGRVATRMPEQARTSLEAIETTGREALTEMRRLLGVLRRDDEAAELSPQPSLSHVQLLVGRARAAGLPVELRVEGEPRPLPVGVDLSAYRVVQEALTDALGAAGAKHARVTVRYGERNVRLEIADDGTAAGRDGESGEMVGMRERLALYGGDLDAGPGEGVEYLVRARLPVGLVRA
jgi:signal transduction histidine kinase